jgi:hypothetical protein
MECIWLSSETVRWIITVRMELHWMLPIFRSSIADE